MTNPKRTQIAKIVVILAVIPVLIYAYAQGPYPGYSGVPGENGDCTACHSATLNSGGGSVTVAFPNETSYVPGVKQHLKVTVQDAAQHRRGFQLTARQQSNSGVQAGSFTAGSDGFTQVICATNDFSCSSSSDLQYFEHTASGTRRGTPKSATFEFDWTPPAGSAGNVVVYVAANAANGDGSTFGDHIYTNTYKVALRPRRPNLPFQGLKTPPVFRQRLRLDRGSISRERIWRRPRPRGAMQSSTASCRLRCPGQRLQSPLTENRRTSLTSAPHKSMCWRQRIQAPAMCKWS